MDDQNGAINWLLSQKRIQASASVRNGNATVNHEEIVGFIDQAIAALTSRHEAPADDGPVFHMNLLSHEDNEAWLESARRVAAKHEAPAEGVGERERLADAYIAGAMSVHEYWAENPGEAPRGDPEFGEAAGDYAYFTLADLRARSSAPEAREGEAVGVVYSLKADLNTAELPDGTLLYTHPAAPSADKLRIAVEALGWYGEQARLARLIHRGGDEGRHNLADDGGKRARQALAALKAEGA